ALGAAVGQPRRPGALLRDRDAGRVPQGGRGGGALGAGAVHARVRGRRDRARDGAVREEDHAMRTSSRLLRIRTLVRKELRQLFRDPRTKRVVFGAPLMQVVLFGYAVTTDVRDVTTFVVDHDQTAASRALVDALTASGYFRIVDR